MTVIRLNGLNLAAEVRAAENAAAEAKSAASTAAATAAASAANSVRLAVANDRLAAQTARTGAETARDEAVAARDLASEIALGDAEAALAGGILNNTSPVNQALADEVLDQAGPFGQAVRTSFMSGVSATQVVVRKLQHDEDARIVVLSDSTANADDEWPYLLGAQLGADYLTHTVRIHPAATDGNGYDTPVTLQTGSGSATLDIYNQSIAGMNSYGWHSANFGAQVTTPDPHLVIISTGHNESIFTGDPLSLGQPRLQFRVRLLGVAELIRQAAPQAQMVLIAQHAWLDLGGDMDAKRDEIRLLAQARGYGFIDMFQTFADDPDRATYFTDNIHPNAAGQQVYADTIQAAFRYDPKWEPRPQPPSLFDQAAPVNLADDLVMPLGATAPVGWTGVNATVSRDTTNHESGRGYGVRVQRTSVAGTPSRIFREILTSTTVVPFRGKWVLLAVRMRRPAAGTVGNRAVGLVSISDGVRLSRTFPDQYTAGAFAWRLVPHFIDAAATTLTVSLWADELGNAENPDVTFDRLMLIPGQWPAGGFGRAGLRQVRNAERFESVLVGDPTQTAGATVELDAAGSNTNKDVVFRVGGVARWILRAMGNESGSNTGSDLSFFARDDSGSALATAFSLLRRYGAVKFAAYATGSRPSPAATGTGAGAVLFDSTLNRPIWSDAAAWHVAASYLSTTATLDFPSIAAGGSQQISVTVTGATVGDTVILGPPAGIETGLVWNAYVSAINTVRVRVSNITGAAIDPASASWKVAVVR